MISISGRGSFLLLQIISRKRCVMSQEYNSIARPLQSHAQSSAPVVICNLSIFQVGERTYIRMDFPVGFGSIIDSMPALSSPDPKTVYIATLLRRQSLILKAWFNLFFQRWTQARSWRRSSASLQLIWHITWSYRRQLTRKRDVTIISPTAPLVLIHVSCLCIPQRGVHVEPEDPSSVVFRSYSDTSDDLRDGLARHDRQNFEIKAYSDVTTPDHIAERIQIDG